MINGKKRYETEKENVFANDNPFQHEYDPDKYQYNDLYTIYSSSDQDSRESNVENAIERLSKSYQPNITSGFDIKHFRLIRSLGQGMNGSVSFFVNDL